MSLVVLRHFDAYALLKKDKLALCGKISHTKSVALTGNVPRKFCTNENEARAPRAVCGRPFLDAEGVDKAVG
jgi:hypothetical protein